ncbi:CU044_5270 family protein [Nonomuraea sp. NPDC005983]|uniref:CU044_5270 family protein n=1 Tax=Nonomuraea sp. NPDC005983 TaxID=3155595 RepID=UPI0033A9873B
MNELQTIRAHHDSLPGPAPQVSAHAWELLAAEAEAERAGSGSHEPTPRRAPGRGFGRVALRAGVVVGLAAAVTAGVIVVRDDGPSPLATRPASAAELLRHAAAVSAGEDLKPRPGQFVYVDRKDVKWTVGAASTGGFEYTQDVRREVWIPAADPGKALTRSTFGDRQMISGTADPGVQPAGTVEYQRAGQCHMEASPAWSPDLGDLPADPDLLLAKTRADAEAFVDRTPPGKAPLSTEEKGRIVERILAMNLVQLAGNPFTTSGQRAVVFGALSKMPTVTMVPDAADAAGRRGVGASIKYQGPDGWEREELVFEPKTYRFLGWRSLIEAAQGGGRPQESLRGGMAVMEARIVDSMPDAPEGTPTFC